MKVLINWYYERFDLTEFLLEMTDEIEFTFLFHHLPAEVPGYLSGSDNIKIIYWGQYSTPYELLRDTKPDKVVFCDIESFNQVALNIAAKNLGLPTLVLQHGTRGAFEVAEAVSFVETSNNIQFSSTSGWSIRFLLSSLRLNNLPSIPGLLKFILERKRKELTVALHDNQFELRRAARYIEFSEENKGYHKMRDGIPDEKFIITGNPHNDSYIRYFNSTNIAEQDGFCLLIDCPFGEASVLNENDIDINKKNQYLERLNEWCCVNGKKLIVKLHPLSYKLEGLYEHSNLQYLRSVDIKPVIAGASSIFFLHFSTLTPVILAYKPAIYFHSVFEAHRDIFSGLNVPVLPLFSFNKHLPNLNELSKLVASDKIQPYLFSTDGLAGERIKKQLLQRD